MNKKSRLIVLIPALVLLAALLWFLTGSLLGILRNVQSASESGESDPMFAEEMELATRPPELDETETQTEHPTLDDYVPQVQTPVEKTAHELIEEEESGSSQN